MVRVLGRAVITRMEAPEGFTSVVQVPCVDLMEVKVLLRRRRVVNLHPGPLTAHHLVNLTAPRETMVKQFSIHSPLFWGCLSFHLEGPPCLLNSVLVGVMS